MKKIQILALSAAAIFGVTVASCDGGSTSTPSANLKTEADTLSYAYGVQLAEGGLDQYLTQLGVLQDTASFKVAFEYRISAETDATKKATLEKELTTKLDSLNKANAANLALFVKGLNESFNTSDKSKDAYYNGLRVGGELKMMSEQFKTQVLGDEDINKAALLSGLVGSLKKETPAIQNSGELLQAKSMAKQVENQAKQAEAQAKLDEEKKKEYASAIEAGNKFMEANKAKAGVVTLPSGLQYKIVKEGKGAIPTASDMVEVFYTGTLTDGKQFDSNVGKPSVKFGVGQVIKGWTEALQLMPVGSKWILYIPYDLAYGAQDQREIPPFSNLIFEVDLVDIVKQPTAPQQ